MQCTYNNVLIVPQKVGKKCKMSGRPCDWPVTAEFIEHVFWKGMRHVCFCLQDARFIFLNIVQAQSNAHTALVDVDDPRWQESQCNRANSGRDRERDNITSPRQRRRRPCRSSLCPCCSSPSPGTEAKWVPERCVHDGARRDGIDTRRFRTRDMKYHADKLTDRESVGENARGERRWNARMREIYHCARSGRAAEWAAVRVVVVVVGDERVPRDESEAEPQASRATRARLISVGGERNRR